MTPAADLAQGRAAARVSARAAGRTPCRHGDALGALFLHDRHADHRLPGPARAAGLDRYPEVRRHRALCLAGDRAPRADLGTMGSAHRLVPPDCRRLRHMGADSHPRRSRALSPLCQEGRRSREDGSEPADASPGQIVRRGSSADGSCPSLRGALALFPQSHVLSQNALNLQYRGRVLLHAMT